MMLNDGKTNYQQSTPVSVSNNLLTLKSLERQRYRVFISDVSLAFGLRFWFCKPNDTREE